MSENIGNDEFDDIDWGDCFTPPFSSTQQFPSGKRQAEDVVETVSKKNVIQSGTRIRPIVKEFCEKSLSRLKDDQCVNKVAKRIFPGPAGLLPDRLETNKSISELVSEDLSDEGENDMLLCSQRTVFQFEEAPWKKMVEDFSVSNGEQLFEKFNISWIKKKSALQKVVVSYRTPFLASVIHSIEVMEGKIPTINVTLKDSSGVIGGTISHSLYEEYAAYLTVGSVVVLKQLGILSVGDSYCVTLTPTNLLTIYHKLFPKKTSSDNTQTVQTMVEKVVVNQMCVKEIWNIYYQDIKENLKQQNRPNFTRIYKNSEKVDETDLVNLNNVPVSQRTFMKFEPSNLGPIQIVENISNHLIEPNSATTLPGRISFTCNNTQKIDSKSISEKTSEVANPVIKNTANPVKNDSDNVIINCSQVIVQTEKKHTEIWKNIFEEVDADSLFEDF
ncbi:homologous recombination OB-fold protein [Leptinotarsa decemlineata]|uniref:homologous recombination OB-fold protein n=1 Tax=Leptinotarsa decemlineata TaxID=7539 RepID=UPI003D306508